MTLSDWAFYFNAQILFPAVIIIYEKVPIDFICFRYFVIVVWSFDGMFRNSSAEIPKKFLKLLANVEDEAKPLSSAISVMDLCVCVSK